MHEVAEPLDVSSLEALRDDLENITHKLQKISAEIKISEDRAPEAEPLMLSGPDPFEPAELMLSTPQLHHLAVAEYKSRARRAKFIDTDLLGEPVWDIMLDLFINTLEGHSVSVTSACIASGAPATSGLRYLDLLQRTGFIERLPAKHDKRVKYIALTRQGYLAMANYMVESRRLR